MCVPRFSLTLITAAMAASATLSYGQALSKNAGAVYPTKPVRLVTSAPGGGVDFTARLLALGLTANQIGRVSCRERVCLAV